MMVSSAIPFDAATSTSPLRNDRVVIRPGSIPARSVARARIRATDRPDRWRSPRRPQRSTGQNAGTGRPSGTRSLRAAIHARQAVTAHNAGRDPRGTTISGRPGTDTRSERPRRATSARSRTATSVRRRPVPNMTRMSARSRIAATDSSRPPTSPSTSSMLTGTEALRCSLPLQPTMASADRTSGWAHGTARPARRCSNAIAASRRCTVAGRCCSPDHVT